MKILRSAGSCVRRGWVLAACGALVACDAPSDEVEEAFIIGITPHADFRTSGLVDFALLPKNGAGEALIEAGIEVEIEVSSPNDTAVSARDRFENKPDPLARLMSALDLDSSGSMASTDPQRLRVDAAKQFVDQLGEDDEVAVFDFGAGATAGFRTTRMLSDFTADKLEAKDAIDEVRASGGTPMYGSILEVLEHLESEGDSGDANRSLVVLGDGAPSDRGEDDVCARAQQSGIPVNTIGFGPAADDDARAQARAVEVLRNLAFCSGGAYTGVSAAEELGGAFSLVGEAVRSGSIVITVSFAPIPPPRARVSGGVDVGNGAQTPVTLSYTFIAP